VDDPSKLTIQNEELINTLATLIPILGGNTTLAEVVE
jgi:hypothetical protein